MDHQLLLLGLLRGHEMHGYQLNEFIDRQMSFCVDLKRSTAYYLLDKLCREGCVSEELERAGNRPERRVYRITPLGERRFHELLRENLRRYTPPVFAEDIGVIFQGHLSAAEAAGLLRERRAALLAHRADLEALAAGLPASHQAVVGHHLLHLRAELEWVDGLIADREGVSA